MRSLPLLAAIALTACAYGPEHLEAVKQSVDSRLEYAYYTRDDRPAGLKPNQTNCVGFAREYVKEARANGLMPVPFVCKMPDGQYHKAVQVGEWVLDNRYPMVVPIQGYDCKPI